MADLLVRDVDDDLLRRLEEPATLYGRSIEAEHRAILAEALRPERDGFVKRAARWRELTAGRVTADSAQLIRTDRDRHHDA
jgi:plasmid stability protein